MRPQAAPGPSKPKALTKKGGPGTQKNQPGPKRVKNEAAVAKKRKIIIKKLVKGMPNAKTVKPLIKDAKASAKVSGKIVEVKIGKKSSESKGAPPGKKKELNLVKRKDGKVGATKVASILGKRKQVIVKVVKKGNVVMKKVEKVAAVRKVKDLKNLGKVDGAVKKNDGKLKAAGTKVTGKVIKEANVSKTTPVKKALESSGEKQTKVVKDRSRSPEKKNKSAGTLRSSSAPLMSSGGSEDETGDSSKCLAGSEHSKASAEDVSALTGKLGSPKKSNKLPEPAKRMQPSTSLNKGKEETKSVPKGTGEKSGALKGDETKTDKPSSSVDDANNTEFIKISEPSMKTSFLVDNQLVSPLGRKKLIGKVKPIARVKGTVIEKVKSDADKKKMTVPPPKIVEENIVAESQSVVRAEVERRKISLPVKLTDDFNTTLKPTKKNEDVIAKNVTSVSQDVLAVPECSQRKSVSPFKNRNPAGKTCSVKGKPVVKKRKVVLVKRAKKAGKDRSSDDTSDKTDDDSSSENSITYSFPSDFVFDDKQKGKSSVSSKGAMKSAKPKPYKNIPKNIKQEMMDECCQEGKDDNKDQDESEQAKGKTSKSVISDDSKSATDAKDASQPKSKTSSPTREKSKGSEEETKKAVESKAGKSEAAKYSKDDEDKYAFPDDSPSEAHPAPVRYKAKKSISPAVKPVKKFITVKPEENHFQRMKLLGFWTGPKRHREASLNAQAKVQCLYENESRSHVELGLMRTVDRNQQKWKTASKKKQTPTQSKADFSSSDSEFDKHVKSETNSSEEDSNPPTRKLRIQPGSKGSGKYWDMKTSSSEDSEAEIRKTGAPEKKKIVKQKVVVKSEKPDTKSEAPKPKKEPREAMKKRRNRVEVVMDLKDMVVKKRMASLNATAILAASYEKRSPKSSGREETTSDSASSEQEDVHGKFFKNKPAASDAKKSEEAPVNVKKDPCSSKGGPTDTAGDLKAGEVKKPKVSRVVQVARDTDVTITGVYSTHHHEAFCTVSGMQYRISATSHTQTTATAAPEKEPPPAGAGPSYTPLGALSSMHPPGGSTPGHLHPGPSLESRSPMGGGSLGRRAGCSSAFSAPHLHPQDSDRQPPGYYQPAGPLISSGPLHGGFKEGAPPSAPSLSMEQTPYTRYQYHQPPQVLHYGNGFGGPHAHAGYSAPGAHYGPVDVCYGGARPPAPPPSCYPPPPAHRQTKQNNTQVSPSPAGGEAYAPQYYQPCYQHTHAAPPRPYIDAAYQGCPCPMQSCPKNGLTGPATGSLSTSGGPATCGAGGALAGEPPRASNEALRAPDTKNQFYKEGEGRGGCCAVAVNPSLGVIAPEAPGPPSPARGSAGASVPQPPDPHLGLRLLPAMVNPPRRARLGKAMARKSIGADDAPGHTMLLMCHTPQTSVSPPAALTPLGIMTDKAISEVKNEVDSGDDVILIDSPRSKIPPIEVSSSEENCNDSKSEKDCVVSVRKEDKSSVELSADTKKENAAVISSPMKKSMLDVQALKEHNVDKSVSICDGLKKSSDKPKSGIKRRCSQPKMEIDLDIDDNLAANGIGEHVKLQKRQKVSNDVQNLKKTLVTGSYKDLIKKPEKVFKLNNGKRQLNTIKVDKCKSSNRLLSLLDSDKLKKVSSKRKSSSPMLEATVNKKKKYNSSLLKSADKKLSARLAELTEKVHDIPRKIVPPVIVTKAKSATILDNLMTKNITMDRVIESVGKNAGDEPATILATKSATKTPVNSLIVQKNRKASTPEIIPTKSRTVLNINNNVVKKVLETEKQKVEVKSRRNSKSPAILKVDKKDVSAKKCEKVPKVESKGKKVNKSQIGVASKGGSAKRKSKNSVEEDLALVPAGDGSLPLGRCLGTPKWSNGWTWEGEPTQAKVYVNNEDLGVMARCWSGMRHARAGDAVRRGDCVLLRAGPKRTEAPFVARVAQLYESPIDGEMMVSLLWYYRPEHTERGRQPDDCTEEVFASRHRDANSVACIEDKCYVLTFNEYCRYRKQLKASEENVRSGPSIVPRMPTTEITQGVATNDGLVPPNTSPDLVLFCRRVYDFRLKKIMKNPPY